MTNILIIQTAFIGDVVLALPVAQKLKSKFPNAKIHFLLRQGNENLLENHPAIDQVWIWNKKEKWSSWLTLVRELKKTTFDLIINLQRFFSMGFFTFLLNAKQKIGFSENPFSFFYNKKYPHVKSDQHAKEWLHEIDRNIGLLNGICDKNRELPKLYPSIADEEKIQEYIKKPYVVLAPASVWQTKQWPLDHWQKLIEIIPEPIQIWIVGGPGDQEMAEKLIENKTNVGNLAGKLSFLQTAALMKNSSRVIANDSAPLHFASAVLAPSTAIFCSTIPQFGFGPLSEDSIVLETSENLTCRPCGLHGKKSCPEGHFICGKSILPETVLNTINYAGK